MSAWEGYTGEVERGTSWVPPEVPDDLYDARVCEVGEPVTGPDFFDPDKEKTQFWISWEILSDDVELGTTLRQYVTIPPGLREGFLHEKATLYKVMEALGFDVSGRTEFNPPAWIDLRARVMVENKPNKDGLLVPRVTDVKAPRRASAKPAPVAKQAVASGVRPPLKARLGVDQEDE